MTNNNKENNKEITTTTITHSLTEGKAQEEKAERLLPYGEDAELEK